MKTTFIKNLIEKIERRSGKGSYGKLVDIKYKGLTFTFHGDHNIAEESDDGKKLTVTKIFV